MSIPWWGIYKTVYSMCFYSGVVNVVTCQHESSTEVGKAMCASEKVAALSFTGSTRVGEFL